MALAPPTGEVGNEDVLAQMKLGLVEEDPASRATTTAVEWRSQLLAHAGRGPRVRSSGSGLRVKHPVNDLGHAVRRDREEVLVRCASDRGIGHGESVPGA
jgi:hypothetical protein